MNIQDSKGESSSKRQENGDVSTTSERPLKKARFAWQVKGKYHLKSDIKEKDKPSASSMHDYERNVSSSDSENDSNDLVGNTEQNLEILGDYLLKQDFNTLDSVITESNKSLLTTCTNVNPEALSYPRYVSSSGNNGLMSNSDVSRYNNPDFVNLPMSVVHYSQSFSEDQCIARWQARQMAKGFVDNTINRVLDSWMFARLPTEMDDNRSLALDVAEFINNLPGDNSIENEGILMAISAHGLQNTNNNRAQTSKSSQNVTSSSLNAAFPSPPSSAIASDEESTQVTVKSKTKEASKISKPTNNNCFCPEKDDFLSSTSNNVCVDHNPFKSFSLFADGSGSSSDTDDMRNGRYDEHIAANEENMFTDHFDFMDAAVSFAIQNKGLTSYGTDYG